MRHLTTEELLLYAEGELEQRELCQHVQDCVECKARMVDLQETYVHAASVLRQQSEPVPVRPMQMELLRQRLALEVQMLSEHLSTQDLLLSVEDGLDAAGRSHLAACGHCQDRAASLHLQLAEIEVELHRQVAFEFPEERRAAALAALRARLQVEIERQSAPAFSLRDWLGSLTLPRVPALAPYAGAAAAVCLVAWLGMDGIAPRPVPAPESLARIELPEAPALSVQRQMPPAATGSSAAAAARAEEASLSPRRFEPTIEPARLAPAAPARLAWAPAPDLQPALRLERSGPFGLLAGSPLPPQLPVPPAGTLPTPSAPEDRPLAEEDSLDSVIDGTWMLVQAGLWNRDLSAGGSSGQVRFSGSVASDRERLAAERALAGVAGDRPVEFAISVRNDSPEQAGGALRAGLEQGQQPTGLVRNSLLQHYEDAARRSFQRPDRNLLESELDRYVTRVLRHDTELLSHANALSGFLGRPGIGDAGDSDRFRKVLRFHLDGIRDHQAGIHDLLSEALARRFWVHRGQPGDPERTEGFEAEGVALREDALALDRALTSLLFGTAEAFDARGSNLSINSLLKRLRQRTERLRDATRQ